MSQTHDATYNELLKNELLNFKYWQIAMMLVHCTIKYHLKYKMFFT